MIITNMNQNFTDVEAAFTARRWRVTLGVREVLRVLGDADYFLSAHDIEKILEHSLDVTTIYRVLEKLQEVRLVHEFQGKWRACSDCDNETESHHFLICESCGNAEEIFLDYHEAISDQLAREKQFLLKKVHLGFLGTCRNCR
jgi:Fe2+ or Zn2+ uptake regulation protein